MPSLATRRWGTDPGLAGTALAGVMVFGGASTVAGGAWADRAHARAARARGGAPSPGLYASFPALCCLAAFPFGALLCVAPSFGLCVALFLPQTAAANVPSGPLRCLVSTLVPGHSRAAANSVLEVGIGLAGGLGPVFVGAVSDALQARGWGDAAALARAMLAIQFASLPAALFLWMAAASAGADLALSARGEGWAAFKAAPPPDPDCYDSDSDT